VVTLVTTWSLDWLAVKTHRNSSRQRCDGVICLCLTFAGYTDIWQRLLVPMSKVALLFKKLQ
jgi:hypothetical protein